MEERDDREGSRAAAARAPFLVSCSPLFRWRRMCRDQSTGWMGHHVVVYFIVDEMWNVAQVSRVVFHSKQKEFVNKRYTRRAGFVAVYTYVEDWPQTAGWQWTTLVCARSAPFNRKHAKNTPSDGRRKAILTSERASEREKRWRKMCR